MLIEFSVENFLSFKDRATLSMIASSDDALPDNVFQPVEGSDIRLLKSAALYGANASGKSNLIAAMSFMKHFVINSSEGHKSKSIPVTYFKLDAACVDKPSLFEVAFLWEGVKHVYGFSVTREQVWEEWFYSYPKKQRRILFERHKDKPNIYFGDNFKGERKRLEKSTRDNSLFISVAAQFNNPMAEIVVDWFGDNIRSISTFPVVLSEVDYSSTMFHENAEFKKAAGVFLKKADVGINGFEVAKVKVKDSQQWKLMPDEMKTSLQNLFEDYEKREKYEVHTRHHARGLDGNPVDILFDFMEESEGTQKLFALAGLWLQVLKNGGLLLADELDMRLHPLLTKGLIKLLYSGANENGAQLIFTTHDSSLLDQDLFRRDQVCITQKNEEGATDIYSLYDIKDVRKEENFRKGYLMGRYGGIPFVGEF